MNKRDAIMVFILAALITTGAWAQQAVELWNGFTNQMNREQVEARAKAIFGERIDLHADFTRNIVLPASELRIRCFLSEPYSSINFDFVNGRLFMVEIKFRDVQDLLSLVRNNYGEPTDGFTSSFHVYYRRWIIPGRIVLFNDNIRELIIFDRQVHENAVREREEASRRAAEKVHF